MQACVFSTFAECRQRFVHIWDGSAATAACLLTCWVLFVLQTAPFRTATMTPAQSSPPTPAAQRLTKLRQQRKVTSKKHPAEGAVALCAVCDVLFLCPASPKKPSDAPKAKKPAAPKVKKPDKSIWDSDSDTGDTSTKKPAPALKGTGCLRYCGLKTSHCWRWGLVTIWCDCR